MKCLFGIATLIFVVCAIAAAQQASAPDSASSKDGVYVNHFFNFTYTYPQGWTVQGEATTRLLSEIGKEKVVSSGALTNAEADHVLKSTHQLLTLFRHPLGTPGIESNPAIQVVAEDVKHASGIADGRTYLLHIRPMLAKTGGEFVQEQPVETVIGGRKFFRLDYRTTVNNFPVHQALVVSYDRGYVLTFIFTATNTADLDNMLLSLKTIAFDSPSSTKP